MNKCRHCQKLFLARPWQIAKSDYECDPCRTGRERAYRAKRKAEGNPVVTGKMNRDYHRAYEARYFSNDRNRHRRNELMKSYAKNPLLAIRHKARRMVRSEIAAGRMTRMPCEICGNTEVHAHHDDYEKPISVRWLCPQHHAEHHASTGEA